MENTVYNKNCAALVAKYGEKLPMQPPKAEDIQARIKVVNGELGFPNVAFVSDNELHRLYEEPNPYKEIQALVEKELNDPDVTHIVTLGLGLGYLLAEIIRCKEGKAKVFVLEPDLDVYFECSRYLDISQLINSDNIEMIFEKNGDKASEIIGKAITLTDSTFKGWRFISTFQSFRLYKEFSKSFIHTFGSIMNSQKLNMNTIVKFGELFIKNSLENLNYLDGESFLSSYKDKYLNKTCMIIAAGPSLIKQLPLIHKIQNQILLIAVGQAIETLHNADIHPHIFALVDPQEGMDEFFEGKVFTREIMLCNTVCDPGAVNQFNGSKIFASYTPETDAKLEPILGHMGSLNNGGSVANFCYSAAKYMGFKTIGFVGQDLAYTNGISHATGHINIESKTIDEMKSSRNFREVPGYYGDVVFTNAQMDMYRHWFETQFATDININIFNCTEGGALIKGATNLSLNDFINKEKANFHDLFEISIYPKNIDNNIIIEYLENDLKDINQALIIGDSGVKNCEAVKKMPRNLKTLKKTIKSITETKKFLNSMNSREKYNPYLIVLWNYSLHQIAKVQTPDDATPEQVVIPFIPFFNDLKSACETTKKLLQETILSLKRKGDPKVASVRQLEAFI